MTFDEFKNNVEQWAAERGIYEHSTAEAQLLKAQEKDAGLLVERVGFLKDGRAVEFSQSFYRGDIYDFVAELSASS